MPISAFIDLAKPYGLPFVLLVIAVFGILNVYKKYVSSAEKTRKLRHEEIKLLSDVLNYSGQNKKFLIEQLIETKYKTLISWREISYLMKLHSPSEALSFYASANDAIKFDYVSSEPSYSAKLRNECKRTLTKFFCASFYFSYSLLGVALLIGSPYIFELKGIIWGVMTIVLIPLFISFAFLSLKQYAEIKFAEKLFELIQYSKEHPETQTKNHLLL